MTPPDVEPTDEQMLEIARANGVTFQKNEASGMWYKTDKYGQPDYSDGLYISDGAAARAWCELHGKMPEPPKASTQSEPPRQQLMVVPLAKYKRMYRELWLWRIYAIVDTVAALTGVGYVLHIAHVTF
jgi:hypothetical protein